MKIIAGFLRGAIIPTAKGGGYRPSTGKFKEALFSILTSRCFGDGFKGKMVLDLFAGTGSLGFEAISRGAKHVAFVDMEALHLQTAKSFAEKHRLIDNVAFIRADATRGLVLPHKYDIIFIDPPYGKKMVEVALGSLHKAMALVSNAILVIEAGPTENITLPEWCNLLDERIYGSSKMIIAEYARL